MLLAPDRSYWRILMREVSLPLPELALIAGTRALLGAGAALLLGDRLSPEQRRTVGRTLLLVGALTTVPLAFDIPGRLRPARLPG